jgi:hypothetical protein
MDALKPYLVLACVAFALGFMGYLMLGQALTAAPDLLAAPAYDAPVAAAAPADGFNRGKHI